MAGLNLVSAMALSLPSPAQVKPLFFSDSLKSSTSTKLPGSLSCLSNSEARVRAFSKSTRTGYVLGTGTRWVRLGTARYVPNKKKILEKKLGTFGYRSGAVEYGLGTDRV